MLPQMERDKLVAEWCRLVGREVSAQVAQKPQGGRPRGGVREAARQLGLSRQDVHRWVQLVGIWWTSLIPARQNCFTEK